MSLIDEIRSQPAALEQMLHQAQPHITQVAEAIRARDIRYVFLAARGTSDNAGLYAKYLWGARNQLPIALAAPSLFSVYASPPALTSALVVGISQSGQSPDIVSVVAEGRRQGALSLAVTNDPGSPLAQAAEYVVDLGVGEEKAVAATKTYTAQLMAIALLSAALTHDSAMLSDLRRVPDLIRETLALDPAIQQIARQYQSMSQCVVLGRGYNYATVFEWTLKLKELANVVAEPYSSADFQHGPIAIVSTGFPVLAVIPDGAVFADVLALSSRLVAERQVSLLVLSNRKEALDLTPTALPLPASLPEYLSPLVSIVPAQLFCYHLTRIKGYNTEKPHGLSKVTLTR